MCFNINCVYSIVIYTTEFEFRTRVNNGQIMLLAKFKNGGQFKTFLSKFTKTCNKINIFVDVKFVVDVVS